MGKTVIVLCDSVRQIYDEIIPVYIYTHPDGKCWRCPAKIVDNGIEYRLIAKNNTYALQGWHHTPHMTYGEFCENVMYRRKDVASEDSNNN